MQRPFLFCSKKQMKDLKKRSCSDGKLRMLIAQLETEAEDALRTELTPESHADAIRSQHGNYYDASKPFKAAAPVLGLAWQLTGDVRYAEKLKLLMLHYAGYQKWCGAGCFDHLPPWQSELNNANFCFAMSVGLDMLDTYLTGQEKRIVADATLRLGILPILADWLHPATRIHALDSMGHNWWSVCVSQAGLAIAAMMDWMPDMEPWLERIAYAFEEWFSYPGSLAWAKPPNSDHGGFYESVAYANYAISEYLLFRIAYCNRNKQFPWDDTAFLNDFGTFYVQMLYPAADAQGIPVGFGDTAQIELVKTPQLLLLCGFQRSDLRWYVEKRSDQISVVWDLICYDALHSVKASPVDLPLAQAWDGIGWAVVRSSFADDANMLAVKCGDTWNHAHADAGSFVLYHGGREILLDSGTCEYGRPEYTHYYCASRAHNVVLFNGQGQDARDHDNCVRARGRLLCVSDGGVTYLLADATGPMGRYFRRHLRHFLLVDQWLLIYDDIETYEDGALTWLAHMPEDTIENSGSLQCHDVTLQVVYPPVRTERFSGLLDHAADHSVPYYGFTAQTEGCRLKFVTAISLGAEEHPVLECFEEGLAVRLGAREVYINTRADGRVMHKNCVNNLGGYRTDGVLLTRAGETVFVVDASFVRKDGKPLHDALRKTTVALREDGI